MKIKTLHINVFEVIEHSCPVDLNIFVYEKVICSDTKKIILVEMSNTYITPEGVFFAINKLTAQRLNINSPPILRGLLWPLD